MRRIIGASCLALWLTGGVDAAEDDPLQLTAPVLKPENRDASTGAPPTAEPLPSPAPARAPSAARATASSPGPAPVLAVPGIPLLNRPRVTTSPSSAVAPPVETTTTDAPATSELPLLDGPTGMPATPNEPALPELPHGENSRSGRTLTLESIPAEDPVLGPRRETAPPGGSANPARRDAVRELPPPRRAPGLLGRFLSPYSGGRGSSESNDGIVVEPRTDPATDAAIKRRLENQIRTGYGDHLRSAEVRVVGRNITIHAKALRFWQRRGIRRALESLPSPNGYHTTVEVE